MLLCFQNPCVKPHYHIIQGQMVLFMLPLQFLRVSFIPQGLCCTVQDHSLCQNMCVQFNCIFVLVYLLQLFLYATEQKSCTFSSLTLGPPFEHNVVMYLLNLCGISVKQVLKIFSVRQKYLSYAFLIYLIYTYPVICFTLFNRGKTEVVLKISIFCSTPHT